MANKKLTDLTELTTPADGDFLYIVDVSDTTESAQGTSKKIRKDKVDSGTSKENLANKQNSLAIDGTGTKYPTVDAVNAIDLQKVLDVDSIFLFDGKHGGVIGGGDGIDRYTQIHHDDLTGGITTFEVSQNNAYIQSDTNYGSDSSALLQVIDGKAKIQQSNGVGSTSVNFTEATENTTLNFPAKIVAGTYTLATNDETVNLIGNQTITGSKTFENSSTNDALKIENTSSGDALNINTTPSSTGKALIIKNNDVEKFSVSKNGYFNSQGGFINGILDFTNTEDIGIGQFYMNLNRFLFTNTSGNLQFLTQNNGFVTYKSPTISGTFSNANLTANRTFTLPDVSGTLAVVSQTITNGVTDKSPSEDAVYDAIDGVVKTIISDTPTSTNTGGVSEVLMHTYTIAAGKLPASCMPNLKLMISKSGTTGNLILKVKVNSVNNFSTSTLIGSVQSSAPNLGFVFNRNFILSSGNLTFLNPTSLATDEGFSTVATSSISYDPSVTQYWFVSLQNSSSADTSQIRSIKMIN